MHEPIDSMAQPSSSPPSTSGDRRCVQLGRNAAGLWVIRDSMGRSAGMFKCRRAALRFARREIAGASASIVLVNDCLEFDYAA
jgi:hypothetical protein